MEKYSRAKQFIDVQRELKGIDIGGVQRKPPTESESIRPISSVAALQEKIRKTNEGLKRINGHSAEYVAASLERSVEEVFPSDGRTVYVGDPWQKLDRKGVVIVDYEFGPVVEFQADRDVYLEVLGSRLRSIAWRVSEQADSPAQIFLKREFAVAEQLYETARTQQLTEYERISNQFLELKQRIEQEIERETDGKEHDPLHALNATVRDLWYVAVQGARAVDVLDWATELDEPYRQFAENLPKRLSEKDREKKLQEKRRQLIESIRFEKTAKEAEVVQAMFPFLPFDDATFDRFVAFWSISTYVFEHLESGELTRYWEEIYRLLKPGGKAYIAPLFQSNEYELDATLRQFAKQHSDFSFFYNDDEQPNILTLTKAYVE
ncbi:MAG: methyltransferase domain-containing protein [Candidatus Kerfeldbacteria bacterium]|nr:methyltransferase domain-containing protein [Candidatus Kerfeldbacteria bacterium]